MDKAKVEMISNGREADTAKPTNKANTVRLPDAVWLQLRHMAVDERSSVSEIIRQAVSNYLEQRAQHKAV